MCNNSSRHRPQRIKRPPNTAHHVKINCGIYSKLKITLTFITLTLLLEICSKCLDVKGHASHQCGPGSIPRSGVICGLSLLVLYSALRGFLRVLWFPLSSKTNIFTSWYDVSHAMGFRVWGRNSIKNHSLTLLDINLCINLD